MGSRRRRTILATSVGATATAVAIGVTVSQITTASAAPPPTTGKYIAAGGDAVPGEFIVVLKPSTTALNTAQGVKATATALAQKQNGQVKKTFAAALKGFSASMSEADARKLAEDPAVDFVQPNHRTKVSEDQQNATWGLDRIDQRDLPLNQTYKHDTTAAGVNAYIIDTGITTSHPEFGDRAKVGTDTIKDGKNGEDCQGHGTHVAGTVGGKTFGVAKEVNLFAVRVLDCQGGGSDASVIEGIDWVTQNAAKPAVANMSLGGQSSPALDAAVQKSVAAGISYAVAAGNEDQDACNTSPARAPEAITVGATDEKDARADFSNFGECVDVFAPGVEIESADFQNGGSVKHSGTSMASPHVAGVAALFLAENKEATPQQVSDALTKAATPDKVTDAKGSPNKLLFSLFSEGGTPPAQ